MIIPGSFRLRLRCLSSSWHLELFLPHQQSGLRCVPAKVHEATGGILSQILQACFDNWVVIPIFHATRCVFLSTCPEIERLFPLKTFWSAPPTTPSLSIESWEEHIGIALFLLARDPDSEGQPIRLLALFRWRGRGSLGGRFVCQRYRLVCILRRACRSVTLKGFNPWNPHRRSVEFNLVLIHSIAGFGSSGGMQPDVNSQTPQFILVPIHSISSGVSCAPGP